MNAVRPVDPPRLTPAQQELVAGVLDLIDGKVSEIAPYAQPWEREELRGWGRYGAVVAAGRFDPALGTRFATYAYTFIAGEILDCLRRDGRHRRLRRAVSFAARTFTAETSDRFEVIWDDEATNDGRLRTYAQRLVAGMVLGVAQAQDTLDDTAIDAEDRREAIVIVRAACAQMSEHERRLHALRYEEDVPMKVVAERLGVSYATARRHHEALLDRVAAALHAGGVTRMPPFD